MEWQNIIVYLFFSFCAINLSAQTQKSDKKAPTEALGLRYIIQSGTIVYNENHEPHELVSNLGFNIVDQIGDTTFIRISSITHEPDTLKKQKGIINSTNTGNDELYYFLIGPKKFIKYHFRDWDVSPLTIPIKIRPKLSATSSNPTAYPLQFIGDVAIGPYLGYEWGSKTYARQSFQTVSQTVALFAAPTYIRLDPTNSSNDDTNTVFGFSFGAAYLFNLNDFQIGFTTGIDIVGGDASETWVYQKKPWVSFAIGFDINPEN